MGLSYCLFIAHANILDARCLGGHGHFDDRHANNAKHVLHILHMELNRIKDIPNRDTNMLNINLLKVVSGNLRHNKISSSYIGQGVSTGVWEPPEKKSEC